MKMQRNVKYVALTLVFLCLCVDYKAQQLVNPSFEGPRATAISPSGWMPYGDASSPDTQPGAWKVTTEASHGYTYLSMVCRGQSGIDEGKWESTQQTLINPLMPQTVYHYSIDLAYNKDFYADIISFDNPVNLRVWGMNEIQQKELLWESGAVKNTDWETYFFELKPNQRTPFLVLEAFYTTQEKYCGNVLLDNIQYYPNGFPELTVEVDLPDTIVVQLDTPMVDIDLNEYNLPTQIDGREVHQEKELLFRGDKLTITVWDNRTTDGDEISLFLNEKTILKEFEISKNRFDVEVNVSDNKEYYLTLYAHNLGRIPPNTVAMYITDGVRKKMITLSSNLSKCEAVKIKIEQLEN